MFVCDWCLVLFCQLIGTVIQFFLWWVILEYHDKNSIWGNIALCPTWVKLEVKGPLPDQVPGRGGADPPSPTHRSECLISASQLRTSYCAVTPLPLFPPWNHPKILHRLNSIVRARQNMNYSFSGMRSRHVVMRQRIRASIVVLQVKPQLAVVNIPGCSANSKPSCFTPSEVPCYAPRKMKNCPSSWAPPTHPHGRHRENAGF